MEGEAPLQRMSQPDEKAELAGCYCLAGVVARVRVLAGEMMHHMVEVRVVA